MFANKVLEGFADGVLKSNGALGITANFGNAHDNVATNTGAENVSPSRTVTARALTI